MRTRTIRAVKLSILACSRAVGLFRVARWFTRGQIRILCYHGISVVDEHRFRPALFMRETTLRSRLEALREGGYDVIPLKTAVERIEQRRPPERPSVVITIDDGFRRTGERAVPMLTAFGMPATLYVTSYYAERSVPIPTLAVQYLLWRTERPTLELASVLEDDGSTTVDLRDPQGLRAATDRLIAAMRRQPSENARQALLERLGDRLGVPVQPLRDDGRLTLMDADAIRDADQAGVDIQLHTHRHVLPIDADGVRREIGDNKAFLGPLTSQPLKHFCYPSGDWDRRHWPLLQACAVRSATTCVPGLNSVDAPLLALSRFVDQDDVHPLEFEAEISGFSGAWRALKRLLRGSNGERVPSPSLPK